MSSPHTSLPPDHHPASINNLQAFAIEVDATKGLKAAHEFPTFVDVLRHVQNLAAQPSTGVERAQGSSQDFILFDQLRAHDPFNEEISHAQGGTMGALDRLEAKSLRDSESVPQPAAGGFHWVNFQTTNQVEVFQLGEACNCHPLTVDDMQHDAYEKVELLHRRGYMYCMVASEDIYGAPARIHAIIFHNWVLTIHDTPSTAVAQTLSRLQDLLPDPEADGEGVVILNDPSWVLYTLIDLDVDWMISTAETLAQEAHDMDDRMHCMKSTELPDILRCMSLTRSHINAQRQRAFSKLRLLLSLTSPLAAAFVTPQLKVYLRDVHDHVTYCNQRLHSADQGLDQSNSNYFALLGIKGAEISSQTNVILGRLTFFTVASIPLNLLPALMGMNVQVPMRDVVGLDPFLCIVATGVVCTVFTFLLLYRYEQQQPYNHR